MVKIVVSQEEYIKFGKSFDALERNYYAFLGDHEIIPVPNIIKVPDYDYDCLLLTGGPDSPARHKTENLLFAHGFKKQVPIIGICHGAFVINDLCGGKHGRVQGHIDCDVEITMYDKKHKVKCYHQQCIKALGKNMTAIAHDNKGNIEAFKHDKHPIYGVVWHPERMKNPVLPDEIKKLLD